MPDAVDPDHDTIRQQVLWGAYMAGGAGVEWYFGYRFAHNDLNAQDWRSRDLLWDQTRHAMQFFQTYLPFTEMQSADALTPDEKDYCFAKTGEVYAIYLPPGSAAQLDLSEANGSFSVQWFDPKNGGELQQGSVSTVAGGQLADLGNPPVSAEKDWVLFIKKR
jgi:hypothetical protein